MSDRSFRENLDLLIKLFKKLKDKSAIENIKGIDKSFYQNFEFLLNNYEMMKDQISEELLDKFGEPVKEMIAGLVEQLKDEVGDDFNVDDFDEKLVTENNDIIRSIEEIDRMLKDEKLSESDINKLLEERTHLKNKND